MDNNNMLKLCRLCLVKDDVNIPIFEEQGDIRQIFLKISSCLPVKVSRDDQLPKKICDGCSYKLDMLYEFWNTSANAEKQLLTWLGEAGMSSQMADGTISAVAQQIKPADAFVKQETIDPPDIHMDDDDDDDEEDKDYMKQEDNSNNVEEPPPKRARRTAAVKAAIALDQNSDDDDDSGEPMTKVEDDSEDSDNEDHEPAFVDVPSTSADDQPGPSGVGKDGVEAPSEEPVQIQCGMCSLLFPNKKAFLEHSMKLLGDYYKCCKCFEKFEDCVQLYQHYENHRLNENEVVITEDMELNYEENEAVLQNSGSETNDMLYLLDDNSYVNEIVIEEDQPTEGSTTNLSRRETVDIVNFEHGYVVTNIEDYNVEEEVEDDEVCNVTDVAYTPTRPRNPQPKKRHEVPDFSATNYLFVTANQEIEIDHFKCLRCEQLFISKFGFFRHIEKGKCYINNCDVCTATFSQNLNFYNHYVAEHPDRAICKFCFRTFMYEKNVKEHMLRHLDQFRHRCEDCNKGFYTVREYRNHYKNRHMGIRHKCSVCGRSFADEYYFKRHIATHAKAVNKISVYQINQ
ncbi:transcription factor E4F1-like isoform X20 [Diorhabda carinulata]|uniref:transcription factor E4F1-like isoform X20 n=1 Tax=Diorhabda carinulata TaxID=1163345 RepID=UPI00259FEA27|nr:transcription factor E4F1-like isoform X20 [Diorhabda carinulata]